MAQAQSDRAPRPGDALGRDNGAADQHARWGPHRSMRQGPHLPWCSLLSGLRVSPKGWMILVSIHLLTFPPLIAVEREYRQADAKPRSALGQTQKSRQRDDTAGLPSAMDTFGDCRHGR